MCSKVKVTSKQKQAAKEWLKLLADGKLKKEKLNYFKFGLYVLRDMLGYDIKTMSFEEGNIEFSFNNKSGNWEVTTKIPARYTATWVNSDKTQRVWLYVAYKPRKNIEKWQSIPLVSCNMAKYWDMAMVKKEIEYKNK